MDSKTELKEAAHDVRNSIHAFEMAIVVLESTDSDDTRTELIEILKNEIKDMKKNLERYIELAESAVKES